jgi:hypothetical protein
MSFETETKRNKYEKDEKILINNYGRLILSEYAYKNSPVRLKKCNKHMTKSKHDLKSQNICYDLFMKKYV